jgi:hypothetical protein
MRGQIYGNAAIWKSPKWEYFPAQRADVEDLTCDLECTMYDLDLEQVSCKSQLASKIVHRKS